MTELVINAELGAVNKALDQIQKKGRIGELLENIGRAMKTDVQLRNFKSESGPDGTPWAKLKPATLKARRGTGAQILRDSGLLRNSISYAVTGQSKVEIGTNIAYAPAHQFGRPEINLPARPFIGIAERQTKKINSLIDAFADDLLK